ncbi:retrotransposon protein [Cucumis melo var. makuwa]|uniref:Retrotransposon protein n=1 Tax=Cucumis melo var. makuwa TaxID=1194695 RepID=A0A5D3C7D1_CUCMM|nr:retrotransposon protein [Cucumis melo var. makuwa]
MIHESDLVCQQSMRMDRRTFAILCHLLRNVDGLSSTRIVDVEEIVAMFLHVLAHDVKNRVIQREFVRSGETVSRHFNIVLLVVVRLHEELIKRLVLNYLGALDGTYIKVNVPTGDRPTFRMHKGKIAKNVLGGFLAPYRSQRYHLQEWRGAANAPINPKKKMTYCDNVDDMDEGDSTYTTTTASEDIHYIETTNEWSQWRDELVESMFTDWQLRNA